MAKKALGGIGTPSANYGKENILQETFVNTPISSPPVEIKSELDRKLVDIIQNSGSLGGELDNIKKILKEEIIFAFNQGCINGNGAARGAHQGNVLNIQEYLSSRNL